MFLVLMAKNECLQPLDVIETMVVFLKQGKFLPKNKLDEGNRTITTQQKVEEFCEEYNRKFLKPESNETK